MKVSDRVRISYANLMRLADHFEIILGLKRKDLRKELSGFDTTDLVHALAINDYCRKHKGPVRKLVKDIGVDQAFFEIAKDVLGRRESLNNLDSAEAILKQIRILIGEQKELLLDLTHLELDEFSHLQDWGLKHDVGKRSRVHILDFAHKLEKKVRWTDSESLNEKAMMKLIAQEKDHQVRDVHLYIIFLLELKRYYNNLGKVFDDELKIVSAQESAIKSLKRQPFGTALFHRHAKSALDKSKDLDRQVLSEAELLRSLIRVLKEIRLHFPNVEDHGRKNAAPFLHVLGHPVQVEGYHDKHPQRISIPHIMDNFRTGVLVFGQSLEFCHVLLHHSVAVHFSIVRSKKGYLLFNQEGSPGTFIMRNNKVHCIVHNKTDMQLLKRRMEMSPHDYVHVNEKFDYRIAGKGFALIDGDNIILPSGYRFVFSDSKVL